MIEGPDLVLGGLFADERSEGQRIPADDASRSRHDEDEDSRMRSRSMLTGEEGEGEQTVTGSRGISGGESPADYREGGQPVFNAFGPEGEPSGPVRYPALTDAEISGHIYPDPG